MAEQLQTEPTTGKWKIWALIAALVVLGGGYFANKMYMEKQVIADIKETLANLPGGFVLKAENISVNTLLKSTVLTKVTGSGKINGETITVSADSAEGKGINLHAFDGKGVTRLGDSLTLHNVKIAGPGLDVSMDLYQLENVEGDFAAISEQYGKLLAMVGASAAAKTAKDQEASEKAGADMLAAMQAGSFDALGTLHIGKFRTENYILTTTNSAIIKHPAVRKLTVRMAVSEGTDYSITHYGPMSGRGLVVEINDKPLANLEEMSLKSMDMPPLKELATLAAASKPSLKNLKMSMQDLRLKKLDITLPMEQQEKISLDDFNCSFGLDKSSGTLGLKVGALDLPTELLVRDNPPGSALLTQGLLPPRILLNKDVDIAATSKDNDVFDVLVKANASIKDLGAVVFSSDLLDLTSSAAGRRVPQLGKLDVSVTDGGFMKAVLATTAMMGGKGGTPEAARADLIAQVEATRETLPHQSLKDVATALAAFLKQPGGTVRVTLAPEKPVPLNIASMSMLGNDAAKLGISSSFTPGK